ncbi:MAG: TetR/AcrR family transcriptional regulator [Candidatus Doudnabacteria bacterium]|nr:TetR/AcrR family transcriptional regulator [Candidatus Doudnabacteria bacterium]
MKTSQKTRQRILAAAKTAFAKWGYDSASMSIIARQAKVDKSSLYYFFKSKDDLFAAITLDTWQQLSKAVAKNLGNTKRSNPQQALSQTCQEFIKISLAAGMSTTKMELPRTDHPHFIETMEIINQTQKQALNFLKKHLVKYPNEARSLIANSVHGYVLHSCSGKHQPSIKNYCDYLSALIIKPKKN